MVNRTQEQASLVCRWRFPAKGSRFAVFRLMLLRDRPQNSMFFLDKRYKIPPDMQHLALHNPFHILKACRPRPHRPFWPYGFLSERRSHIWKLRSCKPILHKRLVHSQNGSTFGRRERNIPVSACCSPGDGSSTAPPFLGIEGLEYPVPFGAVHFVGSLSRKMWEERILRLRFAPLRMTILEADASGVRPMTALAGGSF